MHKFLIRDFFMILDNVIIYFCNIYFLPLSRNSSYCFFFNQNFKKYILIFLFLIIIFLVREDWTISIFLFNYSKQETVWLFKIQRHEILWSEWLRVSTYNFNTVIRYKNLFESKFSIMCKQIIRKLLCPTRCNPVFFNRIPFNRLNFVPITKNSDNHSQRSQYRLNFERLKEIRRERFDLIGNFDGASATPHP